MGNRENLEQVKELIRIKNAELKKANSEKNRQEVKIKHLLAVTGKKISSLQQQLNEKIEQIRFQKSISYQQSSITPSGSKETQASKSQIKEPLMWGAPELDLAEKINEMLKELRKKNTRLTQKIEEERKTRERLTEEKGVLAREVRRLQKNTPSTVPVKQTPPTEEKLDEESRQRFEQLLKEKEDLIKTYEKLLDGDFEDGNESQFPAEIVKQVRKELTALKAEKDDLEKELILQQKKFKSELAFEVKKAEESAGKKSKRSRYTRKKLAEFMEEALEDKSSPLWMTTYADMAILLLTFFILYYSLSSVANNKFKEAIMGTQSASIGLLELLDSVEKKESIEVLTGLKSDDILTDILHVADRETMNDVMDISTDRTKIVIRIPGGSLFEPGSANLDVNKSKPILDEIVRLLNSYPRYRISIQGHTDDNPISTDRFPSNWELSSARATAVLRYFIDKNIDPKRLTATGYADIFPIASNDSELGQSTNRRVEFVLEKEK
ncbi:MAG: OmpA family protein [Nitrospinota bacterium]|nr:OmpA family protein [Nitrospinota bacterium]